MKKTTLFAAFAAGAMVLSSAAYADADDCEGNDCGLLASAAASSAGGLAPAAAAVGALLLIGALANSGGDSSAQTTVNVQN